MSDYTLSITNKKIWNFYKENPHISFEDMNIVFHDIIEKLSEDLTRTLTLSVNSQILTTVKEQNNHISELKNNISNLHNSVSNLNTDITNNIVVKFIDLRKEYVEDVKNIVSLNNNEKTEKLSNLIEKQNLDFIEKTLDIINNVIPKNQEFYNKQLNESLKTFQATLTEDTKALFETNNKNDDIKDIFNNNNDEIKELLKTFHKTLTEDTEKLLTSNNNTDGIKEFVSSFDIKFSTLLQNVQSPIYNYISSSEDRINSNIMAIKETNTSNILKQETIMDELSEYLKKFRNSSLKGGMGESQLENLLTKMYPSGEIINTSNLKASGDFILKRDGKPSIMLENKAYDRNVNPDEVKKFIRDSEELRMHSVFLSQHTGITCKSNYQIEIHKGSILVYVHNVEYSPDKVQVAIDIIENLDSKLDVIYSENEENIITTEVLDDINRDFQTFITQKEAIISFSKENQRKLVTQLENLSFISLEKYLSTKYASARKTGYVCELCNNYTAPTKKSLSAHQRGCRKANTMIHVDTT